jgi:hypothetical protein
MSHRKNISPNEAQTNPTVRHLGSRAVLRSSVSWLQLITTLPVAARRITFFSTLIAYLIDPALEIWWHLTGARLWLYVSLTVAIIATHIVFYRVE